MQGTSTLILVEEKKNLIKNVNETSNHTIHRDFTLEPLTGRNQHYFEHSSLLLFYSIRIKGYMPNLGPHLRHNQHHTLFLVQEQSCSQFNLHMHDQQPICTHALTCISVFYNYNISLYGLTTHLFIGFTIRKTLKIGTQKWLQIHAYHWLQIPRILGFCYSRLQVGLPIEYRFVLHSVSSWSSHAHTSTSCYLNCR
jgi:hypothetical protein